MQLALCITWGTHTPTPRPMAEGWWRCGSFYFRVSELLCLPPSLLTSTGNRGIRNVPIPQRPPEHLHMHSAPICHSWECGGVSSYVPTSTDGTTPTLREISAPPEVTPLPYYSFTSSAWWIMMPPLPYLVCCGNRAHAWIAHSVAFHLCSGSQSPQLHLRLQRLDLKDPGFSPRISTL